MSALTEALAELADAERACRETEKRLSLPPPIFRKRVDAAMARWTAANLAVFDAQVSEMDAVLAERLKAHAHIYEEGRQA